MSKQDLTGKIYGRLKVLRVDEFILEGGKRRRTWLCQCECGEKAVVRGNSLTCNITKSCGCLLREVSRRNTCKIRNNTCEICGKQFTFQSPKIQKTCSKECHRIRRNEYARKLSRSDYKHILKNSLKRIKKRAINNNLDFNLTYDYLYEKLILQDYKCAVTGIKFKMSSGFGLKERSPWSISIDRIDNKKGYILENIRLVCLIYNLSKSSWTDNDVKEFAEKLLKTK